MRYTFTLLGFLFFGISLYSQIPDGYYSTSEGLSGDNLKAALYNIIKGHTKYPYTSTNTDVWDILKETDKDTLNPENVILFYTGWSVNAAQEYNNGNGWTREHIWAKSRGDFGTTMGPGTDVHHLRPVDNSTNSARNNRWFDNCTEPYLVDGIPTGCYISSTSWVFQPRDKVKGDVSRMIFYMATRYEGENSEPDLEVIDYIPADNNTTEPVQAKLSTLLQWNEEDPVDNYERHRNEVIYDYQHNRNPYIDHPEYITLIWGESTSITDIINKSNVRIYLNPSRDYIQIDNPDQNTITIYSTLGIIILQTEDSYITLTNLKSGYYILTVKDSSGIIIGRQNLIVL